MLSRPVITACVNALALLALTACAPETGPDTILINGKVFTANAGAPWAEAIAIQGERIVAVGDTSAIQAMGSSTTRRIDAGGRLIIPGQIEASTRVAGLTADTARALAADAYAVGVTSLDALADGAMRDTVAAFVDANPALRVMLFRRPTPQAGEGHTDSRPYFPPQPTPRINVKGMSFDFGAADRARMSMVVGWAYGSEDPLSVHPTSPEVLDAYVDAIERQGASEVWRAKRPRIEGPVVIPSALHQRLKELGVVVVQRPGPSVSLRSLVEAGVSVVFAPGVESRFASVKFAMYDAGDSERVTAADVVRLMTSAAAFAEFSEEEKGQIAPGVLADLSVLSADLFSVPAEEVADIRSIMTMVGGRVVRETGVIR